MNSKSIFIPITHHRAIDITGHRFGRLVALGMIKQKPTTWLCQCDCGCVHAVVTGSLRRGFTKSCGCLQKEGLSARRKSHGMTGTPTYGSWVEMRVRCNNANTPNYHRYGGRGITICDRWQKFENFYEDMGEKPSEIHSLDRIDNDGNYEPDNCKWSTPKEQSRNCCTNRLITINGRTECVSFWAEHLNIPRQHVLKFSDSG